MCARLRLANKDESHCLILPDTETLAQTHKSRQDPFAQSLLFVDRKMAQLLNCNLVDIILLSFIQFTVNLGAYSIVFASQQNDRLP